MTKGRGKAGKLWTPRLAKGGHAAVAVLAIEAGAVWVHPVKALSELPDDSTRPALSALYFAPLGPLNSMGASVSGAWPEGWDESAPADLHVFVFRPAPAISRREARFTEFRTSRPWEAPLSGTSGRAGPALRRIRQALEGHNTRRASYR